MRRRKPRALKLGALTSCRPQFETLEARQLLAGDLVISEFMARNTTTLVDEDGDYSDWIEVYNRGTSAVSLKGWHLTDNADELDKWSFPEQSLEPGNFLLVRASGKDRAIAGGELHTNFKIGGSGEFLALTQDAPNVNDPDQIAIISQYMTAFPTTGGDVSFGIGQSVTVDSLVDKGDAASLHFPTNGSLGTTWTQPGFQPTGWTTGTNAIGYEQSVPGFTVEDYHSTGTISSISQSLSLLAGNGVRSSKTTISPVVNFQDPGGGGGVGNFGNPTTFPNDQAGDDNDFAIRATATVFIPSTGTWTFGTNSDDGVRLRIDGNTVINDDALHAPENRFGQVNLVAGPHALELVFFERGGGAEVELFAAQGSHSVFSVSAFDLIGDVANGGLAVETVPVAGATSAGFGSVIETNTLSPMYDLTSSAYLRIPFTASNASQLTSLSLLMRYDDGFVAYLNGTEVARRNAPASPVYNSTATVDRLDDAALQTENIDISSHLGLLNSTGINVLAIHALNDAVDSDEFLAVAELAQITVNDSAEVYFLTSTPGAFNSTPGVEGFLIDEIQLSHGHGFYENSFQLTIDTVTDGTTVRYTLDGTEPTATSGTLYQDPITINRTTTLRARAFKNGLEPSNVETATYLFLDDVLLQSPTGAPPAGFPSSTNINGQVLNYGMDPDIVNNGTWGPQLKGALTQIPSMSIVMNINDLLGASNGIYTHAGNHGRAWERPVSLELINPDGSQGFSVNAGLRIRGGYSRSGDNPKHAFRLFFRDEYGDSKLKFPLFEDEGVDEFDTFDLRTTQNYSWAFANDSRNAFVRDVFSRDVQGLMGHEYTRSRFYHLYINGQYWGLYQTEERPEASFAASYLGGDAEDYDVVKSSGSSGGYENEATDGNLQAYQRLANYFYQSGGLGDSKMADYWKAQGMNPDGSRNPAFERLLDVDNLIDYMIITYYTSDADGPGSKFTRPRVNNYFAIYNREDPDGFKFFEHDSEHSLDTGNAAGANFDMVNPLTTGGSQFRYFNPHWMHEQLAINNSEYRQRFADRVHQHLFNDGILTPENAKSLIDARAAQIDQAIIAESARWGDSKSSTPYTKSHWLNAINSVKSFIDNRTPVVLQQLRSQSWYPDTNAPGVTVNGTVSLGGTIEPDDDLSFFTTGATVYSTIVPAGSSWKYLDDGSNQGTAWRASSFNDSGWKSGNAQLGYGDGDEATTVGYGPNSSNKYPTTYFRKSFSVTNPSQYQTLRLRLKRDDGAVVYLNGQEVARSNMPGGTIQYDTFAAGTVGGGDEATFYEYEVDVARLVTGTNVLAVEVHQGNATSSDLSFDLELEGGLFAAGNGNIYYSLDGTDPRAAGGGISPQAINFDGNPFQLTTSAIMQARVRNGNEWSPLTRLQFIVDAPATAESLAITEINYNPRGPLTQFGDLNVDNDEFEFVELMNIGLERIDLTDVRFVEAANGNNQEGIEFRFATQTLDPGERIVVARNRLAFASRYGNQIRLAEQADVPQGTGVFAGSLNNGGELLTLLDYQGNTIQQFEYKDGGAWPGRADGGGSTLEIKDAALSPGSAGSWRSSSEYNGTPGTAGSGPREDVVINELLTHTDLPQIDAIEIYNRSDQAVNIGSWYISDNATNYFEYQISSVNSVLAPGGYRVFDETQLGFGFRGQESDDAWLLAAEISGKPLYFADHVDFGATQNGTSLGRWPNGEGRLFPMISNSFGSANPGPFFDQVVLAEVHYSPAEPTPDNLLSADELEFVELVNRSGTTVDISQWRLNKAIDFTFASGTLLAAGERITVASFDPSVAPDKATEFRLAYGMPATAKLVGPYDGVLDNGGENLELDRPEDLAQLGLGYVLVDRVVYDDDAPWPTAPDGGGEALHRNLPVAYGDFATSWSAADPSPGSSQTAANNPPVAADDNYQLAEGATLVIANPGVLGNDSDPDGDSLTIAIVTPPAHGTLVANPTGGFTYTHNGGETISDQFTYRVNDGKGASDLATVRLQITPVNDPPVAKNDSFSLQESQTLIIDAPGVLANDTDVDSNQLTAKVLTQPDHGVLVLSSNGSFLYTHNGGQALQDQFTYQVTDNQGASASATVTLNITQVNEPPVAVDDQYTLDQGATLHVAAPGVLDSDTDADGDDLFATLLSNPQYGSVTLQSDGSFQYVHDGSKTTLDSFTYQVSDANGGSDVGSVTINIRPARIPGDLDDDGTVDVVDVDLLRSAIQHQSTDPQYDLDGNGTVEFADMDMMIIDILGTTFGDANLDRRFASSDMIIVFLAGEYEDPIPGNSTWAEGDWNCDGEFTSRDMILAFTYGGYEQPPLPATAAVDSSSVLMLSPEQTAGLVIDLTPPNHWLDETSNPEEARVETDPVDAHQDDARRDLFAATSHDWWQDRDTDWIDQVAKGLDAERRLESDFGLALDLDDDPFSL